MRRNALRVPWAFLVALLLQPAGQALAQEESAITLQDEGGNPISGAQVSLLLNGIKTPSGTTNAQGQVTVTAPGIAAGTPVTVVVRYCGEMVAEAVLVARGERHECDDDEDGEDCDCAQAGAFLWGDDATIALAPRGGGMLAFDSWYVGSGLSYMRFPDFAEVASDFPTAIEGDATDGVGGVSIYVGLQVLRDHPVWLGVSGHYAPGLETSTAFDEGTIMSEIDYYALGPMVMLNFGESRSQPYLQTSFLHTWDKGDFRTVNGTTTNDHRVHKGWRPELGGGYRYWVRPRLGLDLAAAYSPAVEDGDADKYWRLSANLTYNLGKVCGGQCGGR